MSWPCSRYSPDEQKAGLVCEEVARLRALAAEMAGLLRELGDPGTGCADPMCRSVTRGFHHPGCRIEAVLQKAAAELPVLRNSEGES